MELFKCILRKQHLNERPLYSKLDPPVLHQMPAGFTNLSMWQSTLQSEENCAFKPEHPVTRYLGNFLL